MRHLVQALGTCVPDAHIGMFPYCADRSRGRLPYERRFAGIAGAQCGTKRVLSTVSCHHMVVYPGWLCNGRVCSSSQSITSAIHRFCLHGRVIIDSPIDLMNACFFRGVKPPSKTPLVNYPQRQPANVIYKTRN